MIKSVFELEEKILKLKKQRIDTKRLDKIGNMIEYLCYSKSISQAKIENARTQALIERQKLEKKRN